MPMDVQRTASIDVDEPSALTTSIVGVNESSPGAGDGSADLTVSGGTSGYTYLWNTGATTEDLTGLGAGTYTVTVTDANGCTAVDAVTIGSGLIVQIIASSDVSCNGGNDGTATASASGGSMPYTYAWSHGQNGAVATNLSAGNYTVTVTDNGGATATAQVTISEPSALTASASGTDVSCNRRK